MYDLIILHKLDIYFIYELLTQKIRTQLFCSLIANENVYFPKRLSKAKLQFWVIILFYLKVNKHIEALAINKKTNILPIPIWRNVASAKKYVGWDIGFSV